jgi:photosystem II stability/assembly factor-like uncharacterized protein
MNGGSFDDILRSRLHRALDADVPSSAATDAILRSLRHATAADAERRPAMRRVAMLAGAGLLFIVFAGLLALAFVVRNQGSPVVPAPARSLPVIPQVTAPVVPGCSQGSSANGCATPPSPAATPTAAPANGPSSLLDLTWISDQVGWALGRTSCAAGSCPRVYSTTDGGQTWHQLPDPPATSPPGCETGCQQSSQSAAPAVSHIRFTTGGIGYLWGPSLVMTTDGGQTWHPQQSANVEALEPSGGSVYRVEYDHTGCPGPCNRSVWAASAGSSSWHQLYILPPPPSHGDRAGLAVVGGQTIYVSVFGGLAAGAGTQEAAIYRSLNGGAAWTTLSDPCLHGSGAGATNIAQDVAAAPNGFVSALCAPRSSNPASQAVVTSTDSGSSWGPLHPLPGPASILQRIAAADASHLAVATGPVAGNGPITYELYDSTDGGIHWSQAVADKETLTTGAPETAYLGFESATTGRWAQTGDAIWTTTDGGAHWVRHAFPG